MSYEAFTFGEPESVLDATELLDYVEAWSNGRWYEPPLSLDGLAKSFRANPHHSSAIFTKRNVLASTFQPHHLLSREAFSRFALDFLVFGNAYIERLDSIGNRPIKLEPSLAKYTRRGTDLEQYFFVRGWQQEHEFRHGTVFHLREPDINQEIYGLPEYLAALQSAWLNESATLFRRKYYKNGSHAGYILYMNDAVHDNQDVDALRKAMRESKGPGNFRNLFLYAPGGKKDGIQVIPLSEVTAKDEFFNIKAVTRDDILAAHRVPPQLMGIVPNNTGGFGAVEPAAKVFARNELRPLQARFEELNDWLGETVVTFEPYEIQSDDTNSAAAAGHGTRRAS